MHCVGLAQLLKGDEEALDNLQQASRMCRGGQSLRALANFGAGLVWCSPLRGLSPQVPPSLWSLTDTPPDASEGGEGGDARSKQESEGCKEAMLCWEEALEAVDKAAKEKEENEEGEVAPEETAELEVGWLLPPLPSLGKQCGILWDAYVACM